MARPKLLAKQLRRAIREACAVAKNGHRESCGLLVDNGVFLEMVSLRNRATRRGRWQFDGRQVRAVQHAVKHLGRTIAGTWHSHPISEARPGPEDIAGAFEDELMLVIDCIGRQARLWRIGKKKAREVDFDAVDL